MYLESWDDFTTQSVDLFRQHPTKTRYVMKYRHCDGSLVLKVTNDVVCLKFKTDQLQDAKKMEKLNNVFFTLMTRGPEADITEDLTKEALAAQPVKKGRRRRQ